MTTLKVGIASYEDMKARTMAVGRGERASRRTNQRFGSRPPSHSPRFFPPATAIFCG
jgi:hypothetical protein